MFFLFVAVFVHRVFGRQHAVHPLCAGDRACQRYYQHRKFDEFDKYLRHIVVERNNLSLRDRSRVDAERADPDKRDNAAVDKNVCQRVHQRGNSADEFLTSCQVAVCRNKAFVFGVFFPECTDNAHARKVFAGNAEKRVELCLNFFIKRNCYEHYCHDRRGHNGYRDRKCHGAFRIDGECHYRRPEHDERGAQKQSQNHVHALLNLLDVCRHTGYESGSSEFVRVRVRKRLYAREQRMTEF